MDTEKQPVDIFEEIKKLNLPPEKFVVVGSGILSAKGIRPAYDLDLVVTQEVFDECVKRGWEVKPWTRTGRVGKSWLKKGNVEMMLELGLKDVIITTKELIQGGENINGIWFMGLAHLVQFKKEYARPKDFIDIALIEDFLRKTI